MILLQISIQLHIGKFFMILILSLPYIWIVQA